MANLQEHSRPLATTNTTMYTAKGTEIVSTLTVCNTSSTDTTYRIFVVPEWETVWEEYAIAYDATITGNDTYTFTLGITPKKSSTIQVYATLATVTFSLFGNV